MTVQFDYTHAFAKGCFGRQQLQAMGGALRQVQSDLLSEQQAGRLGFADLPGDREILRGVLKLAKSYQGRFDHLVVLGIGGSALGFIALKDALLHPLHNQVAAEECCPEFYVLDNIDPEPIAGLLDWIDPHRTLVNVVTKSGSTAETVGQFLIFYEDFVRRLGRREANEHFVITTDPANGPLRKLVNQEGFASLPVPPNVGGRFSVLSPVGLFPAALAGIRVEALLKGAAAALQAGLHGPALASPSLVGAALHYMHYREGRRIAVMMPYSNALFRTADWFRQLWAESLGKADNRKGKRVNVGPTPLAALGATDQHSQVQLYVEGPDDKFYTFLRVEHTRQNLRYPRSPWKDAAFNYFRGHSMFELLEAEAEATRFALSEVGRPCVTIRLPRIDEDSLGRLLMHLQLQTAAAGLLFGVDAFDQPGVETGKRFAFGLMGRPGYEKEAAKIGKPAARPLVLAG